MASPSIFISYSHKDEEWKDRLVTHLRVLEQEKILDLWEDRSIQAGDDWKPEIEKAINKATVAILMISANFLTSKFILSEEVPKLLDRREKQGVRIIPIIVKPCAWTRVNWLSKLQARPKDGRALSAGNENQIDTDLALIADEIAYLAESVGSVSIKDDLTRLNLNNQQPGLSADKVNTLAQRIKNLIDFGDYEKASSECSHILVYNPDEPLLNILMVIVTLKGRSADRYQTKTIKRLENLLKKAYIDPNYGPTALVVWGLIKHDHYKLNGLHQEQPTLDDIKKSLTKIDIEEIEFDLIEKIKASQKAYETLNLLRFYRG